MRAAAMRAVAMEAVVTGRRLDVSLLAFLCALLFGSGGCGDSDTTNVCRPEIPAGRIEGIARTGAAVSNLKITATRIPTGNQSTFVGESAPDATGWYSIDVPVGAYVIGLGIGESPCYLYSRAGLRYAGETGDTLRIDESHASIHADFDLATVRVHVTALSQLDGEYGKVTLLRRGDTSKPIYYRSAANRGSAKIANGGLEIVVPCVMPGAYKMEMNIGYRDYMCWCPYDGEHFWLPATRDSSQTPWVDVPLDQVTDVTGGIDPSPARIEGEVRGAWQVLRSAYPPEISLFTVDSTIVMGERKVDDDGTFGLDIFLPCPVKVMVSQDGFDQWIGGRTFGEAQTFALAHGQTVSGVSFVQSGLEIDVGPDSANFSLMESEIRLYDAGSESEISRFQAPEGGGERAFGIANLRPGSYLLRVEPAYPGYSNWLPQWFDGSSTREGATPITIANEGDVVPVHVTLTIGGKIVGTITDAGHPDAEHLVYFTRADDPTAIGHTFDRNDRSFTVPGLQDGDYKVGAWRQPYARYPDQPPPGTVWSPGTSDWDAAQVISIRDRGVVSGVDIEMSR